MFLIDYEIVFESLPDELQVAKLLVIHETIEFKFINVILDVTLLCTNMYMT